METKIESALMHSRAQIDIEEILFSGEDKQDESEGIDARLVAFTAWQAKLIICTVDTVLGLIQNNRRPLYAWFAISQAVFVFDEVHAYDDKLFGALLVFLKTFSGASILLMSASFKPGQIEAIQQVMTELGEELKIIPGPKNLEIIPRYQLQEINQTADAWKPVLTALANQQKILWVTNSVSSCINLYREAKNQIQQNSAKLLIYHSRFRYQDRLQKHQQVIAAFQSEQPVLAITTQVCEMSLDLSADLLISAMAPAPALIQRLGRLNRKVMIDESGAVRLVSGQICPCLIYPWDDEKRPYSAADMATGKKLVKQLAEVESSQQDLAAIVAELDSNVSAPIYSHWLRDDWCTYPDFLRAGGYTITVLLEQDIADIKKAAQENPKTSFMNEAQKWSVPVRIPKYFQEWLDKNRPIKFYPIAPQAGTKEIVHYSQEMGAEQKWS